MKDKRRHQRKSVEISCFAPDAHQVLIGGTFNNWIPDRTPMKRGADGTWRVKLMLAAGSHEYKFVVDGKWVCEPGVDEHDPKLVSSPDCVPNVHGSRNRKLEV
jgi:1,4-alpha-glucan branching enzyme